MKSPSIIQADKVPELKEKYMKMRLLLCKSFLKEKIENFIKNYFRFTNNNNQNEKKNMSPKSICSGNQKIQTQNIVNDWIGKPIKSPPGLPQQPKN